MTIPGRLKVDTATGRVTGPASITGNNPFPTRNGRWGSGAMMGLVLHTQAGNNPGTVAWFDNPASQASADFCVAQDGSIVQMGPIGKGWVAWAEAAGNLSWYSVEMADDGDPANPLTAQQLAVAAQLLECLSAFAGFPLEISNSVTAKGFGWHGMGGGAWGGHPNCPGDVRKAQRPEIIALAKAIRSGGTTVPAPAVKASSVPIEISDDSVIIHVTVNGKPVACVLDTGDAIGPTFTSADAGRLGLVKGAPFGVEGAGGASSAFETTASITFDDLTFDGEPSAIDEDLQGQSLLGLPFFLARASVLSFDLAARTLSMTPLSAT